MNIGVMIKSYLEDTEDHLEEKRICIICGVTGAIMWT